MSKLKTSVELVYQWAERQPEHTAIKDVGGDISYEKLAHMINALAYFMHEAGVKKGDRVMTLLRNGYENIVIAFAANRLGAAFVMCSTGYREQEVYQRLETSLPSLVFCSSDTHLEILEKYQPQYGYAISTVGVGDRYPEFKNYVNREDLTPPTVEANPEEDVAMLVYTSGSTGVPKGAVHTNSSMTQGALAIANQMAITEKDIVVSPLPMNHMFGAIVGMLLPLCVGATTILIDRFCARDCLDIIEETKATVFFGVPTMYIRAIEAQKENPRNVSTIRTGMVAGALSSEALIKEIKQVFDVDVMGAYGMTEFVVVSMTALDDDLDLRSRSVGRLMPGVEYKIVDDAGKEVPQGADGEIWVKGPYIMKEYMRNPEMTRSMKDEEGWIHTGDIVRMDEDGVLYIRGRKKDLIIRGGRNIYPGEVEKLYSDNENVVEISVVGAPHDEMGEQTVACVVLRDPALDTVESLREYAKVKAIGYMAPDVILFMDNLPKLPNGKVDKVTIKKIVKEQVG